MIMAGPVGYIFHHTSGKLIHPYGGLYGPPNDTPLIIHGDTWGPGRLQFRFVPKDNTWGYIEHISSGKFVHPKGSVIIAILCYIRSYIANTCSQLLQENFANHLLQLCIPYKCLEMHALGNSQLYNQSLPLNIATVQQESLAGGNFSEFTAIRFWREKVWRICLQLNRFVLDGEFQFGETSFIRQTFLLQLRYNPYIQLATQLASLNLKLLNKIREGPFSPFIVINFIRGLQLYLQLVINSQLCTRM